MQLLFLLLALLIAAPSWAAIAFVDGANTGQASGDVTSHNLSAASQVTGNSCVIKVSIDRVNSPTETITGVSDTASSVWSAGPSVTNGGNATVALYRALDMLGNAATVTVSFSASTFATVAMECYSGVAAFGNTNTATGSSTTPSVNVTTQDSNNWVTSGMGFRTSVGTAWSAGTGTLRRDYDGTNSNSAAHASVDNSSVSAGSVTTSATLAGGEAWAAAGIELRSTVASSELQVAPVQMQ
jgi:hypothetical protein